MGESGDGWQSDVSDVAGRPAEFIQCLDEAGGAEAGRAHYAAVARRTGLDGRTENGAGWHLVSLSLPAMLTVGMAISPVRFVERYKILFNMTYNSVIMTK